MGVIGAIEHGFEAAGKFLASPFTFTTKLIRVFNSAKADAPELKQEIVELVQLGEKVFGDGAGDFASKGLNIPLDLQTWNDVQAFAAYFKTKFLPTVAKVYEEVKTDFEEPDAATASAQLAPAVQTVQIAGAPAPAAVDLAPPVPESADTTKAEVTTVSIPVGEHTVTITGPGLHTLFAH